MRMYKQAASDLRKIDQGESLKRAVYNSKSPSKWIAPIYKICSNIQEHKPLLTKIYHSITDQDPVKNMHMMLVLIFELFLGPQKIKGGGSLKRILMKHKERVEHEFSAKIAKARALIEKPKHQPPVQVRHFVKNREFGLNVLKQLFKQEGIEEFGEGEDNPPKLRIDPIVDDLIHVDYKAYSQLLKKDLLKDFIIQGFSSSLPVALLRKVLKKVEPGDLVMDTCSAPGNKTLQLIKYFNRCRVIALERDQRRFQILENRLQSYVHGENAIFDVYNDDFMRSRPLGHENKRVRALVLDPTCSGTGMRNRGQKVEKIPFKRLKQISDMQLKLILHAAKFQNAEFVSYSTCSVERQENEFNVLRALKKIREQGGRDVTLVDLRKFVDFEARGESDPVVKEGFLEGSLGQKYNSIVKRCLRVQKSEVCDGFFVAIFKLGPLKEVKTETG